MYRPLRPFVRLPMLAAVLAATLVAPVAALADTTIPGLPPIPSGVTDSPIVRSILDAAGGITQSTTGGTAYGRVTYFRRYDLELQTAPRVYRVVHLHPGTTIFPRGGTPAAGKTVEVAGRPQADGSLNADTVTIR